jgi:hypothetical protein
MVEWFWNPVNVRLIGTNRLSPFPGQSQFARTCQRLGIRTRYIEEIEYFRWQR